jgi:hypothetical protein
VYDKSPTNKGVPVKKADVSMLKALFSYIAHLQCMGSLGNTNDWSQITMMGYDNYRINPTLYCPFEHKFGPIHQLVIPELIAEPTISLIPRLPTPTPTEVSFVLDTPQEPETTTLPPSHHIKASAVHDSPKDPHHWPVLFGGEIDPTATSFPNVDTPQPDSGVSKQSIPMLFSPQANHEPLDSATKELFGALPGEHGEIIDQANHEPLDSVTKELFGALHGEILDQSGDMTGESLNKNKCCNPLQHSSCGFHLTHDEDPSLLSLGEPVVDCDLTPGTFPMPPPTHGPPGDDTSIYGEPILHVSKSPPQICAGTSGKCDPNEAQLEFQHHQVLSLHSLCWDAFMAKPSTSTSKLTAWLSYGEQCLTLTDYLDASYREHEDTLHLDAILGDKNNMPCEYEQIPPWFLIDYPVVPWRKAPPWQLEIPNSLGRHHSLIPSSSPLSTERGVTNSEEELTSWDMS